MLRKSFRRGLGLGILLGAAIALYRTFEARREVTVPTSEPWSPVTPPPVTPPPAQPEPEEAQPVDEVGEPVAAVPPATNDDIAPVHKESPRRAARAAKKATAKKAAPAAPPAPWIDPEGRICPPSHPVKGKLASKIFHLPGGFNYERTVPDRCYRDPAAAEEDGLRPSKR